MQKPVTPADFYQDEGNVNPQVEVPLEEKTLPIKDEYDQNEEDQKYRNQYQEMIASLCQVEF